VTEGTEPRTFPRTGIATSSLHLTSRAKRQRYGEYREAWELLKETGLTIQVCVDPEWEMEEMDSSIEERVVRGIPCLAKEARHGAPGTRILDRAPEF